MKYLKIAEHDADIVASSEYDILWFSKETNSNVITDIKQKYYLIFSANGEGSLTINGEEVSYSAGDNQKIEFDEKIITIIASGNTTLTMIEIPNTVTSIGDYAFNGCTGLTSVDITNSVTSIGVQSFMNCYSLSSIAVPDSVTSIKTLAFYWNNSLTSATIGNGVTSIEKAAFAWCKTLAKVTYNGVSYTSKSALTTALTSSSVTVGDDVFYATSLSE